MAVGSLKLLNRYSLFAQSLILLLTSAIHAVDTGADFLKLGVGGRPSGMGEAFVSVSGDFFSPFWNPAGIAGLGKKEAGTMHSEVVQDASIQSFGAAFPFKNRGGTAALNALVFSNDPVPVTGSQGEFLGDLEWQDRALVLTYADSLGKHLKTGIGLRYIERRESDPVFGTSRGDAFAGDLGLIFDFPELKNTVFGMSLLNAGSKIRMEGEKKKDDLPRTFKAGASFSGEVSEYDSFLISLELSRILDGEWQTAAGIEYSLQKFFFVRTGYFSKEGRLDGMTYGVGARFKTFRIDWANVPSGELIGFERSSRISFSVSF